MNHLVLLQNLLLLQSFPNTVHSMIVQVLEQKKLANPTNQRTRLYMNHCWWYLRSSKRRKIKVTQMERAINYFACRINYIYRSDPVLVFAIILFKVNSHYKGLTFHGIVVLYSVRKIHFRFNTFSKVP